MSKRIQNIELFKELFEKIKYESEKYWASYTAMMFYIKDKDKLEDFSKFLLKYLRISDTIYLYSKHKILVILEETTIRWSMILNERLREKIKNKNLSYDYYCSSIQWDFISDVNSLESSLKKRLKKAIECDTKKCVSELSCMD